MMHDAFSMDSPPPCIDNEVVFIFLKLLNSLYHQFWIWNNNYAVFTSMNATCTWNFYQRVGSDYPLLLIFVSLHLLVPHISDPQIIWSIYRMLANIHFISLHLVGLPFFWLASNHRIMFKYSWPCNG